MKTKLFEIRSRAKFDEEKNPVLDENGKQKYSYQAKSNLGWLYLYFTNECREELTEEQEELLKSKFFEIEVEDNDACWNITNKNGFDVIFISKVLKITEKNYMTKKEKYFGK